MVAGFNDLVKLQPHLPVRAEKEIQPTPGRIRGGLNCWYEYSTRLTGSSHDVDGLVFCPQEVPTRETTLDPVSYTHLTLPTILLV